MTKTIQLSPDLRLPLDAATRRLAILAMSGAGKSNVAVVMAEQMYDAGIPWVAIDPKGDWWGVRSSKDGKGPGLPVPIFGGLHGDIPLEASAGKVIADAIVDQRLTCVLDISEFPSRQQQWGFLIDLGETLLRRNREALHLFIEEADEILPQKLSEKGNLPKCLGVWQRVVKRGRFRGIGSTQITQRNASLNKDTLYMAEALIAMRVVGKADREAVRGWVEYHNASKEIIDSLPTLPDGMGWVSSPAWLKETKRVQFARRRTFDSGATPVHLQGRTAPTKLADVDLGALQKKMAETIERAKADDPALLHMKIRELEREVRSRSSDREDVEPIIRREVDRHKNEMARLLKMKVADLRKVGSLLEGAVAQIGIVVDDLNILTTEVTIPAPAPRKQQESRVVRPGRETPVHRVDVRPADSSLSPVQQKIIDAIAGLEKLGVGTPDKATVAALCGYHPNAKSYANAMGALRSGGIVEYPTGGRVKLTAHGDACAVPGLPVRSLDDLHQMWYNKLGGVYEKILRPVILMWPGQITAEELAKEAGYHPNAKAFANAKGRLRTLGLIDYPASGMVQATEILFPKALT